MRPAHPRRARPRAAEAAEPCSWSTSSRRCSRSAATSASGRPSSTRCRWRRTRRRVQVVLAVRADFYGHCAAHERLARLVGANQVLVGPMRRDELRRAIEEPAERAGLRVEPSLTDALIADVLDEPGGLPLLSAALLEQWRERDGRVMRHAAYERTGGVRGAVGRLAERTYAQLSEPEQRAARRILLRLPTPATGDASCAAGSRSTSSTDASTRCGRAHRQPARDRGRGHGRGRARGAAARVAAPARVARGGRRGPPAAPAPDPRGARLGRRRPRTGRALPRRAAGGGARLGRRATADDLNALEREFLDDEPRRGRARGRAPAAHQPPPARAARGLRRPARARAGGRRRRAQPARRGARRGARPPTPSGSAPRRSTRTGSTGRCCSPATASRSTSRPPPGATCCPCSCATRRSSAWSTPAGGMFAAAISPDGRLMAIGDERGDRDRLRRDDAAPARPALPDRGRADPVRPLLARRADARGRLAQPVASGPPARRPDRSAQRPPPAADRAPRGPRARSVRVRRRPVPPDGRWPCWPAAPDGAAARRLYRVDPASGAIAGRLTLGQASRRTLERGRRPPLRHQRARPPHVGARSAAAAVLRTFAGRRLAGAVSPDGRGFALGAQTGGSGCSTCDSGAVAAAGRRRTRRRSARMRFTPDWRTLVTGDEAGRLIAWDVAQRTIAQRFPGHAGEVERARHLARRAHAAHRSGADRRTILWDLAGDRRLDRRFTRRPGLHADRRHAARDRGQPDGRTLALTHVDGTVDLLDTRTLRRRAQRARARRARRCRSPSAPTAGCSP